MAKILISTTSFGKEDPAALNICKKNHDVTLNPFGTKLSGEQLLDLAQDADGIIAGTETINKNILLQLPGLKVISRCGTGLDNVDIVAAKQLGIKVFNTPDAPTLAVAELTVCLILDLLRKVSWMDRSLRGGLWEKQMGALLSGKKVGIIGFGRIGCKVADLLCPFGIELAYNDLQEVSVNNPCIYMAKDELIGWADIITLHCPVSADGWPVLGKKEFEKMKEGSWLVNTARGGLVDEAALFKVLKEKRLAGAALDVFEDEPYKGPLLCLDNVILTPHVGSYARESRIEMEIQAVKNLLQGLSEL